VTCKTSATLVSHFGDKISVNLHKIPQGRSYRPPTKRLHYTLPNNV